MRNAIKIFFVIQLVIHGHTFAKVVFHDAKGDARGNGDIIFPSLDALSEPEFDITRIEFKKKAGQVYIKATFAKPIKYRVIDVLGMKKKRVFFPQVEVYLSNGDSKGHLDLPPGRGCDAAIPWDSAIIITALPEAVRVHLNSIGFSGTKDIYIPTTVRVNVRSLIASVPEGLIPCKDLKKCLFFIGITGLRPVNGLRYKFLKHPGEFFDPFVIDFDPSPGGCSGWDMSECRFGVGNHPVKRPAFVDIVAPEPVQKRLLSPGSKKLAFFDVNERFVWGLNKGVIHAKQDNKHNKSKAFVIKSCKGDMITLIMPDLANKISRGDLGDLLGPDKKNLGKVVVIDIIGRIVVLKMIGRHIPCAKALKVRF